MDHIKSADSPIGSQLGNISYASVLPGGVSNNNINNRMSLSDGKSPVHVTFAIRNVLDCRSSSSHTIRNETTEEETPPQVSRYAHEETIWKPKNALLITSLKRNAHKVSLQYLKNVFEETIHHRSDSKETIRSKRNALATVYLQTGD